MSKQDLYKGLTREQIKKINACKSTEDLLNLAKAEGVELSEEQLSAINGGCTFDSKDEGSRIVTP